jgi:hypothetical protein
MSYGLSFVNNNDVVVLDSEFARLVVVSSGTYWPNAEHGLGSIVAFPHVITTQEPPLIFARPDTSPGIAAIASVIIGGSPGAWTGFSLRTRSVHFLRPSGRWFAAVFQPTATAPYGLRLWDGGARLLFDSGTPCAVFSRAFANWQYVKSENLAIGYSNFYTVPFDFPENEYLMINNFSMNMVAGNNPGRMLSSLWDFNSRQLWAVTTSTSNPTAFYLPALFGKLNT